MNKVITINLAGNAYQLEEAGYDTLHEYLDSAADRLERNPDRAEILSDIERAIADKFRALLSSQKNVVETKEVASVIAEMGPIEADSGEAANPGPSGAGEAPGGIKMEDPANTAGPGPVPRRLYRIYDGAMISGVCNGIAAYFNIDPTFVRLGFVLLTFLWGTGLLVYIVIAIVVPEARSPEEKSAASGPPPTAQDFIRRAKEGYYEAMKHFPDKAARRDWNRKFKREMRGWRMSFDQQMRAHAEQYRQNWHRYWGGHGPVHPGMGFTLPFLSLLHGAMTVVFICALVSLLHTSALFGLALPPKVPVWLAAVVLFMTYGILSAPLKAARRVFYWGYGAWPLMYLVDATIWIAVVVVLVWLGMHFFPDVREAIHTIPALAQQAAHDIQSWWKNK
jgi:phage shock protein PspC (stress-responsive transcriptional regulator)